MMATYYEIQQYVRQNFGIGVGTNCIAEAKEKAGYKIRQAHNRISVNHRISECPEECLTAIFSAFKYFGMRTPKEANEHNT